MTFLTLPFQRSLRQRLPVVTSVLITGVLASFLWVAFREVEGALIDAGAARAQGTADQLASLLADTAQQRVRATRRVARDSAIHRFLKYPLDPIATDAARLQLMTLGARGQPPVELWDAQGRQLLVVSSPPASTESIAPPDLPTTTPPSERGVRAFQEWNGAIFWDTVDEVRTEPETSNSPLLGYIRSRAARLDNFEFGHDHAAGGQWRGGQAWQCRGPRVDGSDQADVPSSDRPRASRRR